MSTLRRLPTVEQRDFLINVTYGSTDPRPPVCSEHNSLINAATCPPCKTENLWRKRMQRRFHERGFQFALDGMAYKRAYRPAPPSCPDGHGAPGLAAAYCIPCQMIRNYRQTQYVRARAEGKAGTFDDFDALRSHLKLLVDAGMSTEEIASSAQCGVATVNRLLSDTTGRKYVRASVAAKILDIPVPSRYEIARIAPGAGRGRVDATGTRRRIQAGCREGYSIVRQADLLGYDENVVRSWLVNPSVPIAAADDVATLFPRLIKRPFPDPGTVAWAIGKGWARARHFSATNIDDPTYEPFDLIRRQFSVVRRLQSLAWDGFGPDEVAEFIGESPSEVERWLRQRPIPAFAGHLVAAAFESLVGPGPNQEIARRARREGWAPPLAWHDIDIDHPNSKPQIKTPTTFRIRQHPLVSQIWQALIGVVPAADLITEERVELVRILNRAGWSDRRIASWTRWNTGGDLDKGKEAVNHCRQQHHIFRPYVPAWYGCTDDNDHIVAPPAA